MLRKTLTILSLLGLLLSLSLWGASYVIPYRTVAQGGILADSFDLSDGLISWAHFSADFLNILNEAKTRAKTRSEVPRRMTPVREPISALMPIPSTPDTKTQLIIWLKHATIEFHRGGSVSWFVRVRLWVPTVASAAVLCAIRRR